MEDVRALLHSRALKTSVAESEILFCAFRVFCAGCAFAKEGGLTPGWEWANRGFCVISRVQLSFAAKEFGSDLLRCAG